MTNEPTDLEMLIQDAEQTANGLSNWADGFADARNVENAPYIVIHSVSLLYDYIKLLKEQNNDK